MRRTCLPLIWLFVIALLSPAGVASAQDAAMLKKGKQVYDAQKCSTCHAIGGKGGKSSPLDGVGKKLSAADTKEWILRPVEMAKKSNSTKKPVMPAKYTGLAAADVDALVAYMQSLK